MTLSTSALTPSTRQTDTSIPENGVWVPVPTFFATANLAQSTSQNLTTKLDLVSQAKHLIHLANSGITGIVLLGSTGEVVHVTRRERNELISSVRGALDREGFKGFPLMAGTASSTVDETVELLNDASSSGAQFGLVLAPGYFSPQVSQVNITAWYKSVADQSPIPILIYHYPGVSNNVPLSIATFGNLASHPNIVGTKFSHGNVSHHTQVALSPKIDHSNFRLFSGQGQQLLPVVIVGGAGVIDGLTASFPRTVTRLYKLSTTLPLDKAALEEARKIQYLVSAASEFICVKWGVVGIKEAVYRVLGIGNMDGGRLPISGTVDGIGDDWSTLDVTISELREIEASLS